MNPKLDFVHDRVLSYAQMQERVKSDPSFPEKRRSGCMTNMNRVLKWCAPGSW